MRGSRKQSVAVKFTANFVANLASLEAFLVEAQYPQAYDRLPDELAEVVVSNIERFPAMGFFWGIVWHDPSKRLHKQIACASGLLSSRVTPSYVKT